MNYSHGAVNGNQFLLEGGYFNFDKIVPILKTYGIEEIKDNFSLIGLMQNKKTVDEYISDFKKYDTADDWTYGFNNFELKEIAKDLISFSLSMTNHLAKYGFVIYDTSANRGKFLTKF